MAWTPSNLPDQIVLLGGSDENQEHAEMSGEVIPGNQLFAKVVIFPLFPPARNTFELAHSGYQTCAIGVGESLVLFGGRDHTYVTR